jgi:GDPmannose 4,6-dehydratase
MTKRALITGVTGQDGAYLSQLLLDKGYEVHGLLRRSASSDVIAERLRWLGVADRVRMVDGNLTDMPSLLDAVSKVKPDEVYNLGAQSFVKTSWDQPQVTAQVTAVGVLNMLEAVRRAAPAGPLLPGQLLRDVRADPGSGAGREDALLPAQPLRGGQALRPLDHGELPRELRDARLLGILFNHESPLRGIEFVTRKVTDGAARIKLGLAQELRMGNMDAERDWGHARDYVRAMWLMLQQDTPDDYVVATGRTTTVREMCRIAFAQVGLDYERHVVVDPALFRPAEVDRLLGDPARPARSSAGCRKPRWSR